jgi:hypothetical protein
MVYGVAVIHDTDNYDNMKLQLWKNGNANLLFNKGCEAVFICEPDAISYAYEQSEIRKIGLDLNVYYID